jgi:hypothetical protein
MKPRYSPSSIIFAIVLTVAANAFLSACKHDKSAADTIEPVKRYFESQDGKNVVPPDFSPIEGTRGMILTWKVSGDDPSQFTEYSWVLAGNTDNLKKTLIMFDSARAWNTETYIFLPVSLPAVEIHESVGLSVPQTIYDEDGMNRIREIVLNGETPRGGFVDQLDQFMK